MSKNKRYLLIILAVLAIYLLVSNSIFLSFVPANRRFYNYKTTEQSTENGVFAAISDLQYAADIYETLMVSGWVVCTEDNMELSENVRFVLKNSKNTYASSPLELSSNAQAKTLFKSQIKNDNISFNTFLSTINIKNGNYNAYLELAFDNEKSVLYDLGQSYKKNGTNFELSTEAELVEPSPFLSDDTILCAVSEQADTSHGIPIIGWCHYADGSSPEGVTAELIFESGAVKYFDLKTICNLDTAQMENTPSLIKSAFNTRIPKSELEKGNIKLSLILSKNNIQSKTGVVAQFLY